MNNPGTRQESNLENATFTCCVFLQKVKGMDEKNDYIESLKHGKGDLEKQILGKQIIETDVETVLTKLTPDGRLVRKNKEGKVIESAKSPEDVKRLKEVQDCIKAQQNQSKEVGQDKDK